MCDEREREIDILSVRGAMLHGSTRRGSQWKWLTDGAVNEMRARLECCCVLVVRGAGSMCPSVFARARASGRLLGAPMHRVNDNARSMQSKK